MISPTVKSFLLANLDVDEYSPLYRKVIFVNLILIASSMGLGFFALLNYFVLSLPLLAYLEFLFFLSSVYALYDIRKREDISFASIVATFNLFVFFLMLIYLREAQSFTLIWTIFIPITAIFIHGSRKGLYISAVFYIIAFTYTYMGIGEWLNGFWTFDSYIRFVVASLILLYIIYIFELSFEKSYIVLEKTRAKEREYVRKLQVCSMTDHLTELFNRRELDNMFDQAFEKAEYHQQYFSFFILDLDQFKIYNDTYGHIKGDGVLQKIAQTLKDNAQENLESVFRLGGEEFCGLLIADTEEEIFKNIEKIQADIKKLKIKHRNSTHGYVSASFGVCIIDKYKVKSFDKMYKVADKYLYEAKENGRNCIKGSVVNL